MRRDIGACATSDAKMRVNTRNWVLCPAQQFNEGKAAARCGALNHLNFLSHKYVAD